MDEKLELLKKLSEEHKKEGIEFVTTSKNPHVLEWTKIVSETAYAILDDDNLTQEEKDEMVSHFMAATKALKDTLYVGKFANAIEKLLSELQEEEQGEA
jgi:hypothetical protein